MKKSNLGKVYGNLKISKVKVGKIFRDIIDDKYINSETGEVLDIVCTKNDTVRLRRNYYKFSIINKSIMRLYDKLGATYYGHLLLLVQTMGEDNSIDYNELNLSTQGLKSIKSKFKELNLVKKGKLRIKDTKRYTPVKYYLNPDVSTYGKTYSKDLKELFN